MGIMDKKGKVNPLDAAIIGLDKAIELMDKAEGVAVKISEKNEFRKREKNESAGIERLYPDDSDNAFLYLKISNERVHVIPSNNVMSFALLYRFTFFDQDGKLVYQAKTESTKRQNIVLYDVNNQKTGEISELASGKQPYYNISITDGEHGDVTCSYEDGYCKFYYKDFVISHPIDTPDKLKICDGGGTLVANMVKHRLKKCLVFHSYEDDVLMALLLLSVYAYPISMDRIMYGGKHSISTKGASG